MGWKDEVEDGVRELLSDGAGLVIEWSGYQIPAIQGSAVSLDTLANGGVIDSENPSYMVIKSDLARIAGGEQFAQGDIVICEGKTLIIKTISFDPSDPTWRIETVGEAQ